jgi:hypothetical protein
MLLFLLQDGITNIVFIPNISIKMIYLFYLIWKCQMLSNVKISGDELMNTLKD